MTVDLNEITIKNYQFFIDNYKLFVDHIRRGDDNKLEVTLSDSFTFEMQKYANFEETSHYEEFYDYWTKYTIKLTESEQENMKIGVYNEKTKILKELEYMYLIRYRKEIKPFKSLEEKNIFIHALSVLNPRKFKYKISDLKHDAKNALKSDLILDRGLEPENDFFCCLEFLTKIICFFCFVIFAGEDVIPCFISLAGLIYPPLVLFPIKFIPRLIDTYYENNRIKERIKDSLNNIDYLSKDLNLSSEKIIVEENENKLSLQNENLNLSVLNKIDSLVELLSHSNLDAQVIQIYSTKIQLILDAYTMELSTKKENNILLDKTSAISQVYISELSKIENDIITLIEQSREIIQCQVESKASDSKIYSIGKKSINK